MILGIIVYFGSCTTDKESDPSPSSNVSVLLNGNQWSTDSTAAQVTRTFPGEETKVLTLVFSKFSLNTFSNLFIFIETPQVGTFNIGNGLRSQFTEVGLGGFSSYDSENTGATGSVTISEFNYETGKLKGTFSFTINDGSGKEAKFTEGSFDMTFLDARENVMNLNYTTEPSELIILPAAGFLAIKTNFISMVELLKLK